MLLRRGTRFKSRVQVKCALRPHYYGSLAFHACIVRIPFYLLGSKLLLSYRPLGSTRLIVCSLYSTYFEITLPLATTPIDGISFAKFDRLRLKLK
jgi:hypothetical protein